MAAKKTAETPETPETLASDTTQLDTELEAILSKPDLQDWAHGLANALHAKFGVIPKAIDFNPKMGRIRIIGVDNSGRGARVEPVNFDEDANE